jgi:hypothetical protein
MHDGVAQDGRSHARREWDAVQVLGPSQGIEIIGLHHQVHVRPMTTARSVGLMVKEEPADVDQCISPALRGRAPLSIGVGCLGHAQGGEHYLA